MIKEEMVEERETYFEIFNVMKNVMSPNKKTTGDMAKKTPLDVATALPPLKLANTG